MLRQNKGPLGGIFLISGGCIGAGMLAFPIASGVAGFVPALFAFIFSWLFMTCAAFLLLEVNLRFGVEVSLVTMAQKTLGPFAKRVVWLTFLFLFYALTVAYITGSVSIIGGVLGAHSPSKTWLIFLVTTAVFAAVFWGSRFVVSVNRWLMIGLILTYIGLVFSCAPHVEMENLSHANWGYTLFALPVMMVSFGFQNLIPSITDIYHARTGVIKQILWYGGLLTLVLYLLWQFVVQGVVPLNGKWGIIDSLQNNREAAEALIKITREPFIGAFAWSFGLFAIFTSFLAQSLSLVDFIADGIGADKEVRFERFILALFSLGPPFVVALIKPKLFLSALGFAGGICAMILFGIIPALMCWKGRKQGGPSPFRVFGGNALLLAVILLASGVIVIELIKELGFVTL